MKNLINIDQEINEALTLSNTLEPQIMAACIRNTDFLFHMSSKIKYLQSPYIKGICKWCIDFYEKHGRAPGQEIEQICDEEITPDADLRWLYRELIQQHLPKFENTLINFEECKTYLIKIHRLWD